MAHISVTETDTMDIMEQKGLVDIFIKELKKEQGQNDIVSQAEITTNEGDTVNKELPR